MRNFYQLEEEEFPPEQADVKETMLFDIAREMRDLTEITEARVMGFADALKALEGDKHVFLVFQRDVLPEHGFSEDRQAELLKTVGFDVDRIKRYFADASITIHSLFITKAPNFALNTLSVGRPGVAARMQDLSSDIFAAFREMAVATGGLTESTSNPDFALRQATEASGNYYLLYYRPVAVPGGRGLSQDRGPGQGRGPQGHPPARLHRGLKEVPMATAKPTHPAYGRRRAELRQHDEADCAGGQHGANIEK